MVGSMFSNSRKKFGCARGRINFGVSFLMQPAWEHIRSHSAILIRCLLVSIRNSTFYIVIVVLLSGFLLLCERFLLLDIFLVVFTSFLTGDHSKLVGALRFRGDIRMSWDGFLLYILLK